MIVHGTDYSVKFRYVWARPKHKDNLKFHIAKQYEGTLQMGSANLFGKTYFECSFYHRIWANHQVEARELTNFPGYFYRCAFCSDKIEEYEAKIEKAKEKKSDEEDILMDETPEKKSKLDKTEATGRDNIKPPYFECTKCYRRYAMEGASYKLLDGTGIKLESYEEHTGNGGYTVHIHRCECERPVTIEVVHGVMSFRRNVLVARPVVK